MRNVVLTMVLLAAGCVLSSPAAAQDIDLSVGGAGTIWTGTAAGARAGASLQQGAVSLGANAGRRDLIIGSPGTPTLAGKVHIVFDGAIPTGEVSLSSAHTLLNGAAVGDEFGAASAVGSITVTEKPTDVYPKNLVVGAPGSLSNRGIVYVYAGGFQNGNVVATTSAIVQILGRPGDRLGAALATGDLNNDGYGEIIIGAPGQGRIYIIAGAASLPATIDLTTTAAALTYESPGLGVTVAAGDVTGDGIYDVVVGHPSANAVHVLKGRNGVMPTTAFNMTFGGINSGDLSGTAIRLAFLDGDDFIRDIVIGAPGGDGPANLRTDAGEVYVLFGGPLLAGGSLAAADATFYGAEANGRLGALLGSGDINRDTPNDLVMGAPSGHGGAGRFNVFYGRNRGAIQGQWDFATVPPSRGILGDPAAGEVASAFVWEVTGAGARDVILGAPARNGNTGAAYFVTSPRLDLASANVAISGFQGVVSSSSIPVSNISEVAITWETLTNKPWLSATPEGSTSASTPGDVVVSANGQGLLPGTHTGTVTVVSTSEHLSIVRTIQVTFQVTETQPTPATGPVAGPPPGAHYKIFWRHSTENWLAFWNMNGISLDFTSSLSINRMTDTAWQVAAMGDLNGDGHKDLIWRHTSGSAGAWLLNDNQVIQTALLTPSSVDVAWRIRGAGDLNGDGRADIVWQNTTSGDLGVWFMDGTSLVSSALLSIPRVGAEWVIQAVGDTDGNGRADLLWRNTNTGDLGVWFMNGSTVTGTQLLSIPSVTDVNWAIVGTEDINGDARSDILWQHTDGTVGVWGLNGGTVTFTQVTNPSGPASSAWRIGGPK